MEKRSYTTSIKDTLDISCVAVIFALCTVGSFERQMNYNNMDEKIKFNIRGTTFVTRRSTLDNLIPSRLSRLTKESSEYEKNTDEYFYDRSPSFFNWILDIHSSGEIHVPSWMCSVRALQELEFWEISCKVQPCCWKTLYENDNGILESMMVMDNDEIASRGSEVWPEKTHGRVCSPVIKVLRDAYDHPFKSRTGKVYLNKANIDKAKICVVDFAGCCIHSPDTVHSFI